MNPMHDYILHMTRSTSQYMNALMKAVLIKLFDNLHLCKQRLYTVVFVLACRVGEIYNFDEEIHFHNNHYNPQLVKLIAYSIIFKRLIISFMHGLFIACRKRVW